TAPERRERVAERERAARVLRHVHERQVAAPERYEQQDRRAQRRRERRDERVLRRDREPAPALPRGKRSTHERVCDEREAEKQCRAAEIGHYAFDLAGVYFDGHFVTSEPGFATNVPLRSVPSTTTCRPVRNRSGTLPE